VPKNPSAHVKHHLDERVHVGLGIGAEVKAVPSVGGPVLFNVLTAEPDALAGPNERGLVLAGHDSPRARLSAAIRLLSDLDPSNAVAREVRDRSDLPAERREMGSSEMPVKLR
jgi:hypothetical protein